MGYVTVEELRQRRGFCPESVTDLEFQEAIDDASQQIDDACGQWFEPRQFTDDRPLRLDGSGSSILPIPIPIIRIDGIEVTTGHPDDPITIAPTTEEDVVVYNRHLTQGLVQGEDDREDPQLIIEPALRSSRGIITFWPVGEQNVALDGWFGYTDPHPTDPVGNPLGVTPRRIKKATRLIVARELFADAGDVDERQEVLNPWTVASIKTVDQSVGFNFTSGGVNSHQSVGVFTGIPEVDNILMRFMFPSDLRSA